MELWTNTYAADHSGGLGDRLSCVIRIKTKSPTDTIESLSNSRIFRQVSTVVQHQRTCFNRNIEFPGDDWTTLFANNKNQEDDWVLLIKWLKGRKMIPSKTSITNSHKAYCRSFGNKDTLIWNSSDHNNDLIRLQLAPPTDFVVFWNDIKQWNG